MEIEKSLNCLQSKHKSFCISLHLKIFLFNTVTCNLTYKFINVFLLHLGISGITVKLFFQCITIKEFIA